LLAFLLGIPILLFSLNSDIFKLTDWDRLVRKFGNDFLSATHGLDKVS
jgi:hypothetical protein